MWNFSSNCMARSTGPKNKLLKPPEAATECSDDEISWATSTEEGLECPICWDSFNIVENVPYVLWCGHTLCKNCVLGLKRAVVKFPSLPIRLPLFISCPWCNLFSLRLVYKGNLRYPRKNFFLLWMVESMNGDRVRSHSPHCANHQPTGPSYNSLAPGSQASCPILGRGQHIHQTEPSHSNSVHNRVNTMERLHPSLRKSLAFFAHLTSKFPLIVVFLLIVLYAIPTSVTILAMYILITIVFALPSFLILYFAFHSLDWLVREIIS